MARVAALPRGLVVAGGAGGLGTGEWEGVGWRSGHRGLAVAVASPVATRAAREGLGAPAGIHGRIGSREESEEWRTEEIRVVIGLGCRVGCAVRTA